MDDLLLTSLHIRCDTDSFYRRKAFQIGSNKAALMREILQFGQQLIDKAGPQNLEQLKTTLDKMLAIVEEDK